MAVAALLLFISALSRRGVVLCFFVAMEFLLVAFVAAYLNQENLWQYRETYYYFYIGYALKDLFLIFIISKIKSKISWVACLAFLPSMIYHFLTITEIHQQYYPLELNDVKLSIITLWGYMGLVDGNQLLLNPVRKEFMRIVCSLEVAAMILAIAQGADDGGKRIIDFISNSVRYSRNLVSRRYSYSYQEKSR